MSLVGPEVRARLTPEGLAFLGSVVVLGALLLSGPRLGPAAAPAPSAPVSAPAPTPSATLSPQAEGRLLATAIADHDQIAELEASLRSELAVARLNATAIKALLDEVDQSTLAAATTAGRLGSSPATSSLATSLMAAYDGILAALQTTASDTATDPAALGPDTKAVVAACAKLGPLTTGLRARLAALASPTPNASPSRRAASSP